MQHLTGARRSTPTLERRSRGCWTRRRKLALWGQLNTGINVGSVRQGLDGKLIDTVTKIDWMTKIRKEQLLPWITKQYLGVCLESSNKLKVNSVVLFRHIKPEIKREPLKLARVLQVHESPDGAQKATTISYCNICKNNRGEWIGKKEVVDRAVQDLILVDNVLSLKF